ncbi:MAG: DUF4329 domain-containing protein [Abitibacteriaceae bacterium]|nr:DUF4329 domain-containing protein [Abditibacteriaceae bacterium]MBV9866218.1 DUF4329 domain-containing protein [Abditibacteriaceae bacterium]
MAQQHDTILADPLVRAALQQAWRDSQPGMRGGHEEGGFILQDPNGDLRIMRWPTGSQSSIVLPPYSNCKIGESDIVATFHTHPNTGSEYLQEPSETDKRAIRDDPDLKGEFYEGEFIISQAMIYLVNPDGQVNEIAATGEIFAKV